MPKGMPKMAKALASSGLSLNSSATIDAVIMGGIASSNNMAVSLSENLGCVYCAVIYIKKSKGPMTDL